MNCSNVDDTKASQMLGCSTFLEMREHPMIRLGDSWCATAGTAKVTGGILKIPTDTPWSISPAPLWNSRAPSSSVLAVTAAIIQYCKLSF